MMKSLAPTKSITRNIHSSKPLFITSTLMLLLGVTSCWDYANNGHDWTDPFCLQTNLVQSPRDLYHNGTDWYTGPKIQFSFLPLFAPSPVAVATVSNYVYTVNATTSYGQIFAKEPTVNDNSKMVKWDANSLRFHYPSEHQIQGKQLDLEMQIFVSDPTKQTQACISKQAAIAVLFKISETDNPFFSWLDQADDKKIVDLSQIFTPDIALNQFITGYIGSDTMPPCTRFLCWYVLEQPYAISQKQLDKIKAISVVAQNTRFLNPGKVPTVAQVLNAKGIYAPADPTSEQEL